MPDYRYSGEELDTFAHATNWKAYLQSMLGPYLAGDVLEVGAGIGGTTRALCSRTATRWVCLEPDASLAATLTQNVAQGLPISPHVIVGTVASLAEEPGFDTILYVDVLEHIEDDRSELQRAVARLRGGGTIVALSPAHPQLYSEFDRRIGHYRRYTRAMYEGITPAGAALELVRYLDSAGMLLSYANRLVLRSGEPTVTQIRVWDRAFVTVSRKLDPILGWKLGKSVVGVWRKDHPAAERP